MKCLRISALLLLALMLNGCDDMPKVRMVGSPAPDFTVQDPDRTVSLHDLRGKLVVLNFWTSWCKECMEEMPSLIQMQRQMRSKVTVLAVSIDDNERNYRRVLRDYGVDCLMVWDPKKRSGDLYGITGQPETFIIDGSGTLRRKFIGPVDWTSQDIVEYLNKL